MQHCLNIVHIFKLFFFFKFYSNFIHIFKLANLVQLFFLNHKYYQYETCRWLIYKAAMLCALYIWGLF